jgi:hypothetical protein
MAGTLVPIAAIVLFFWGIVALTRTISDGRLRRRILEMNPSPELVRAMAITPKQDPALATSLRWGIVITTVALGIMTVGYFNIEETAFGFGVVLLGAGVGLLIYYAIAKRQYDRALENGYDISAPLRQQQRPVP